MTESINEAVTAIQRAAADLVPQLSERLRRHGLGEIEIRQGALRLRVAAPHGTVQHEAPARADVVPGAPAAPSSATTGDTDGIRAPAVGFFVYADGLGPGLAVEKGDAVGWV